MKKTLPAALWVVMTAVIGIILTIVSSAILFMGFRIVSIVRQREIMPPTGPWTVVLCIGWVALIVFSKAQWKRFEQRCPVCKKWAAISRAQTIKVKEEEVSVAVSAKHRNIDGNVIGSHEQYVPGTKTTFRDIYKCKYCGHEYTCLRTSKSAKI